MSTSVCSMVLPKRPLANDRSQCPGICCYELTAELNNETLASSKGVQDHPLTLQSVDEAARSIPVKGVTM
ncbi:hypothetical protein CAAN1_28S00694 [[Candida] anglica]|uniref:Uncharacterized protein n=1 Tax=[Candida] anglica TaxID=148631 RepID=A0ABP0ER47_9ASCO